MVKGRKGVTGPNREIARAQWASMWNYISGEKYIKTSHMFPRPHVVAPYFWKWFQMILRPFQIAVNLKFMGEN